jgi:uncharacterized protein (DUF2267 family)
MTQDANLDNFYQAVQRAGKLRTEEHARRWTAATLKTLGINLDGRTKRRLARALPEDLKRWLTDIFWLVHFRNGGLSAAEFLKRVARRAGNSDFQFAPFPVSAVLGGVKQLIDEDLQREVAEALSPEVRELWQQS